MAVCFRGKEIIDPEIANLLGLDHGNLVSKIFVRLKKEGVSYQAD